MKTDKIIITSGGPANIHPELSQAFKKNDSKAGWVIGIFSFVVFSAIVALGKIKLNIDLGFNPHVFAKANAIFNSLVAVLLITFLISYICHHLFTGDTKFGGEGTIRYVYLIILITHIFLAAVILPFILFTAYRALITEWPRHTKLARITWPIWLYVSITGPIVYLMISPYYN